MADFVMLAGFGVNHGDADKWGTQFLAYEEDRTYQGSTCASHGVVGALADHSLVSYLLSI